MDTYELMLDVDDDKYMDSLIVSLVRQGYNVYRSWDAKQLCVSITEDNLTKTTKGGK